MKRIATILLFALLFAACATSRPAISSANDDTAMPVVMERSKARQFIGHMLMVAAIYCPNQDLSTWLLQKAIEIGGSVSMWEDRP